MSFAGLFTPDLMARMQSNPATTASLANPRINSQQRRELDRMQSLTASGRTPNTRPRSRPTPRPKAKADGYAAEFDRLADSHKRRFANAEHFAQLRRVGLVDQRGHPTTPT